MSAVNENNGGKIRVSKLSFLVCHQLPEEPEGNKSSESNFFLLNKRVGLDHLKISSIVAIKKK